MAEALISWSPLAFDYSDIGGHGRLKAVLQGERGRIAEEVNGSTTHQGVAEGRQIEPAGRGIPLERREGGREFSGGGGYADTEKYHPRSELSSPPEPLQEIAVGWPSERQLSERMVAVFILHIDEFGVVREVISDVRPSLPDVDEVVNKAFLGALFSPGRIGERSVRSSIRIEVVFESAQQFPNPVVVSDRKGL